MPQKKPQTLQQKQSMTHPYISKRCPKTMKLTPGKQYSYCTCGLAEQQPWCNGTSCVGTKFRPLNFIAKNQTNSSICLCKHNDKQAGPYCDGNHSDLQW